MEYKITNTKINLKQLAEEAGVDVKKLGVKTKGDDMWFFSDALTQSDIDKVKIALESHTPEPIVTQESKFNETQLAQIRQIIQEEISKK